MIVAPRQEEPGGVRPARPPTVSVARATVAGGLYVPAELAEQAARASRVLAKPNPEYTQWLKRCQRKGKQVGAAPPDQYVAAGLLFDGPWAGGWWMPRHAPVAVLELVDATVFPPAERLELQVALRPFQQAAIDAWLWEQSGTVIAPCGAGKTTIGAAAIAALRTPALVLVHTLDLVEQWRARCASQLGVEAGLIGDGQVDVDGRRVVVGTIQTLASWTWSERYELGQKFGLVILDEAHHAPARTFAEVMAALPGRYRLGLTATPKRQDGLDDILWWTCGRKVFEVRQRDLESQGYTMAPDITWVPTQFAPRSSADDWTALMDELAKDADRNALLVRGIVAQARAGRCVLVLADRVSHCEELAARVKGMGVPAKALTGRLTKKARGEVLRDVLTGALPVVTATSLADEGLDLAVLDCVVLAAPSRNEGRVQQRVGRVCRPWDGKLQPLVFDLVDPFGAAQGMARKRRKLYERLGWSPPPLPRAGGAS
jgi:superfamily II DNA or RNA helicase